MAFTLLHVLEVVLIFTFATLDQVLLLVLILIGNDTLEVIDIINKAGTRYRQYCLEIVRVHNFQHIHCEQYWKSL
jgi:hypothetical protein